MNYCLRLFLLFFFISSVAYAQQTNVKGTVISGDDNEPIIGASVTIKGNTSVGTVTDFDGNFELNVPAGAKTLVISYIGMKSQEVAVRPVVKVTLETDAQQLGEVVVTGMQKMDKRLFTGATTRIDADKAKLDGMADISRGLEGRAAGVSVQNVSGTFGTAPKIRVRGATSIYGSSKPLWVVDGVVMEDAVEMSADDLSSGDAVTLISSAIAGLNPDDIESFQILKDGSATSIYGARAMAGVVVVTTKKGTAGVSKISYTGEFTTRLKPNYRDFNMMNSQEQMDVYEEMRGKGWLNFAETYRRADSGVYGKMYDLIHSYQGNGTWGLPNTKEAISGYLRDAEMRNTNWFDELFNVNLMQNHAVSISSGTEKARYYASVSVLDDPGWYKKSSVRRYTANLNTSFNISKQLTISLLSNASYRQQKAPGTLSQDIDAVRGEVKRDFDINPYSYSLNTSRTMDANTYYTRNYAPFNILDELENNNMELDIADMKFQGEINWKPVRGLEFNALGAVRYQNTSSRHDIMDDSNQASAYRAMGDATIRDKNPLLYTDPDILNSLPMIVLPQGGIMDKREYKMLGYDFRLTGAYNTSFNDTHIMNLFAGTETNSTDRSTFWSRGYGEQYSKGRVPFFDYNLFKQLSEQNSPYFTDLLTKARSVAFFGMATYSYKGKYTLNGTIRYEGTNRMGKSRSARWLPTWNVAGAWNAHEESWFEKMESVLSHMTLKTSYSLTGERGPAWVTNSAPIFKQNTPWRPSANDKESGMEQEYPGNPNLTYEKKHEFNIGADLGFLDNRINFSIDGYWRNNFDLIGMISTVGTTGIIDQYANAAEMKGHGVELTLSTRNIVTKDFTWNTDFIFSNARTKITKLNTKSRIIDLVAGTGFAKEGTPARAIFSIPFMGLNEEGLPTFLDEDGKTVTITGIDFQSRNTDFLKYEGPTEAPITGSFGNIFTYKGFRLNVFITYSFGNVVRLDPAFRNEYTDLDATPKEFKNRWSVAGDEARTNIPVIASKRQNQNYPNLEYAYNAYNYSDVRIAKGDFIRMKEVSLAYDFINKPWMEKLKLNNLQLKLQATNLFLIYADSKLNGQDPEFFRSGGVSAPVPKQFTFTVRFSM